MARDEEGAKLDDGKPRWSLLPMGTVRAVIGVLEYGARKYSPGNWQEVPDARIRYYDALQRHAEARYSGELCDEESGLPHMAHAACCCLFLLWFDERDTRDHQAATCRD